MKANFDLRHLQKIHGHIFQDIYSWAGKIRTVDIAKGNMFCKVQFIEEQASVLFAKLKEIGGLRGNLSIAETKNGVISYIPLIAPFGVKN